MASDVFISYQRADVRWARLLHTRLQSEGVAAWYDAQIGAGQDWRNATAKELEASRIFVLLFSSSAAESGEVAKELAAATLEKKLIIPVRLENVAPKGAFLYELASRNWINAFEHTETRLNELASSIARVVKSGVPDGGIPTLDRLPATKQGSPSRKRWTRRSVIIASAVILASTAAIVYWKYPTTASFAAKPVMARIAVAPFEVLGNDDSLRQFAGGLQPEIIGHLSQGRVPAVSYQSSAEAQGAGAGGGGSSSHVAYVFSGTVERNGSRILVRARLDDALQNVAVWSADFLGDSADPRPLQEEVSTRAAQVGASAASKSSLANGDPELMGLLIKGDLFALGDSAVDREAEWENAQELAGKFPNVAGFNANLAIVGAVLAINSTPDRATQIRATAKAAALRALAIDPHDSLAYIAQCFLVAPIGGWAERETFLLSGLSTSHMAGLTNNESNLLREVGRLKDAVEYARQAQSVNPPSANRDASLILALGATGNTFEAGPLADAAGKAWPTHPAVWYGRLELAIYNVQWDTALALLTPGTYVPLAAPVADAWRSALKAAKSTASAPKREAVRQIIAQFNSAPGLIPDPPYEVPTPGNIIIMLAVLGDFDAAFAQSQTYLKPGSYADSSFLFAPNLNAFRHDPRFIQLAARIGLLDYWRSSGKWPDFCADATLPYSCRAESNNKSTQ